MSEDLQVVEVDGIPTVEGYIVIATPAMWEGYKALLLAKPRRFSTAALDHVGEPERYPCIVRSHMEDGGDYADYYDHEFTYLEDAERQTAILRATQHEIDAAQATAESGGGEGV